MVKLKEPKIHFGTKELIEIGKIVAIKNRFNPFKKTKLKTILGTDFACEYYIPKHGTKKI